MKKLLMFFIAVAFSGISWGQIVVSGSVGADGTYASLTKNGGAFAAINAQTQTGAVITISITGDVLDEDGTNSLNAGEWTSITITPSGDRIISGTPASGTPLITFNGADNVTINGLNDGSNSLTIANLLVSNVTSNATIRLYNDASNNTFSNLTLKGSTNAANGTNAGIVWISTGSSTGNDNNSFQSCKFTAAGTNLPTQCIVANGSTTSTTIQNSGIVINNCEFFDYFSPTVGSSAIYVSTGNTNWSITNNKIYQTAPRTVTTASTVYGIYVVNASTSALGEGFTITGNTIGYSSNSGTGTMTYNAGTTAGGFYGIHFSASAGSPSTNNISNNVISDIQWTSTSTSVFYGINSTIANTTTGAVFNLNNNTVRNINFVTSTSGMYGIVAGYAPTTNINSNTITNLTRTGSGLLYCLQYTGTSSTNVTINQNNIYNINFNNTSSSSAFYAIYSGSSPAIETFSNNNIYNLTTLSISTQTIAGIYNNTASTGNKTFTNNSIYGVSIPDNSTGNFYGIRMAYAGTTNVISDNKIYNVSGGTNIYGIAISSGTTNNIFRNNIYNLSSSVSSPTLYGLSITSGTTNNIYNNFISDLKTPAANSAFPLSGIHIAGGTNANVYYNTVYLNASSTGALFGSQAIYASTTPTLDMRNNIFVNVSTPNGATGYAVAYRRSSTTLTTYANVSNNNCFYALSGSNQGIFYDGTNFKQSMADYKTWVSARDAASFSEDVDFMEKINTPYDLRIKSGSPTQCESGGQRITTPAITDDYYGTVRALETGYLGTGTAPDVGAFEGELTPLDLIAPVINYTPLANTSSTTDRTLSATITDASGVDAAYLYWRANTDPYQAVQGVNTSGNTWEFTFGGNVNPGDVISYYIVAQDINKNVGAVPNAGITSYTSDPPACSPDPTNPSTYTIVYPVCGQYSIGAGKTFESITAALAYITANEVTCPIELLLSDTYNSSSETYPITINQITGVNATNTLTIKPDAGVTASITGNSTSSIFKLNGADYITIDGSNSNGTDRSLTITNNSTSGVVIWNASMGGVGNGAKFNTFKNLNIIGGSGTTSSTYGIVSAATSSVTTAAEDNDNLTILNCNISKVYYGISAINSSTSNLTADNLVISNNTIGSNTASDYVIFRGIQVAYANAPVITKNVIFNLITSSSLNVAAIDIGAGVIDGSVTKNIISGIYSTSTSGYGAYGINFSSATGTTNVLVANNFISDLKTANYSSTNTTYNAFGIRITGGTNLKIYHNSINMFGTVTSHTLAGMSANMVITAALTGLDVRNNIFVNTQTFGVAGSFAYNIYLGSTGITFANINNNDYWGTSGTNTTYIVGYDGSTARTTLNDWKTYTTQDANSVAIAPVFTSPVNLLLTPADNATLNDLGTNLYSFVPDDIEDHQRSTTPDMGADEFTPPLCSGAVAGTAVVTGNSTFCGSGVPNITASGYSTGLGSGYQWQYSNDNFQTDINDFVGQTNPATLNTGSVTSTTYYRLKVTCTSGQAVDYSNIITITIKPVPSASASGNGPLCAGGTINLSGSTDFGTSFAWTGPNGFSSTDQNPTITSATTANSGVYSLTTAFDGCNSTPSTVNVTVNAIPSTVTVTPASADICSGTVQLLTASGGTIGGTGTIGTGSSSNTTTTPYKGYWGGNKSQFLFTASELTAIGLTPGTPINAIRFSINTFTSPYTFNNFTIGMKNTTSTVLTTTIETGVTTVLAPTTLILSGTAPFTVTHNLTTPFVWDGSNLLIETCFTNNDGGGATGNSASVLSTTTATNMSNYFSADNSSTVCSSPGTASVSTLRPNIWFSFSTPTYITWSPLTDLFTDPLAQTPYTGTATNTVYASPSTNAVYTATATSTANCTNSGTSSLTIVSSPSITSHPASSVKCSGQTATFSVTASIPNVTYQWRKDGQNIDVLQNASAATSTLQINNVSTSDAGNYDVIVSAACGTPQISDIATLTIIQTPTASASSNLPVCSGSTLNLYGTTDIGTTFAWTGPNGFSSTDQNPVLNNVTSANSGTYSFVATHNGCSSLPGTVNVTVNPTPTAVTVTPNNSNICEGFVQQLNTTGGMISSIKTLGTGTSTNTTTGHPTPYGTYYKNHRVQYMILPSELTSMGAVANSTINSIAFNVIALNTCSSMPNFTIKMKLSSNSALTTTFETGTYTTVWQNANFLPTVGWNTHQFTQPFVWDGVSSIIVDICFDIIPGNYTQNASVEYTSTTANLANYYRNDDNPACGTTASATVSTSRANMKLGVSLPTTITWSPVTSLYTDASATSQYDGVSHAATVYAKPSAGSYNYTATATSTAGCTSVSNTATVVVNPILNVGVSISTPQTTVNDGTVVTFTATPTNGGTNPSYQWYVNGNPAGTNSNVFSYAPANNDAVTCQLTSDITSCVTNNPAMSNTVTMTVISQGAVTRTWAGTVNNDWSNALNWANGLPSNIDNVIIPANATNYPTISAPVTINNLTIESNSTGTGSLLDNGNLTINGSVSIKRYISGNKWHLLSSPIANALSGVFHLQAGQANIYIREYNPTNNSWSFITALNTPLPVGKGYGVWADTQTNNTPDPVVSFNGQFNTGNITVPMVPNGWNVIGNPYPSAINWTLVDKATSLQNFGAAYFWRQSLNAGAGAYATHDGTVATNGATNIIPPMQGFFVKANTASLSFNNSMRLHTNQQLYNKSAGSVNDMIRITASNGADYTDETVILFNSNATNGFDSQFDALKLFSNNANAPEVYTVADNNKLVINRFGSYPAAIPMNIRLGVNANITLNTTEFDNYDANISIKLEDMLTGNIQDLRQNPSYTFAANIGENDNRFVLHFAQITGINEINATNVSIYTYENTVYVNTNEKVKDISIYNMLGQLITSVEGNGKSIQTINLKNATAYYLVKVTTDKGVRTEKVFIK